MFSGIVEEIGKVKEISRGKREISVLAEKVTQGMLIGDSISVNGVCLTVTACERGLFACGLLEETRKRTNVGILKQSSPVNLERALEFGKRVGGHFVTGHVDGIGEILEVKRGSGGTAVAIGIPSDLVHLASQLGSICVDGVSLTIFGIEGNRVKLSLTPFTLSGTIAGSYLPGGTVNIEVDILARYVDRIVKAGEKGITLDFLRKSGYIKKEGSL
ncbi:MAG: riboflavin synthase [Candidatus Eisenbacteria bacterium]|nr:riboflavin synthase [Candidatus Eisenbacteria bacterium]